MEELSFLSLGIPEPAKIPNEEWIIEMATAIATTIKDKRIRTILYWVVRLTKPIRCVDQANPKAEWREDKGGLGRFAIPAQLKLV
jgi:hypothetical protein